MADTSPPRNPRSDGYGYNPRCIKRDLSNYLTARDCTTAKIAALITGASSIGTFQNNMQSSNGVHSGGHFTISGDPGSDFYTSPGDPAAVNPRLPPSALLLYGTRDNVLWTKSHPGPHVQEQ